MQNIPNPAAVRAQNALQNQVVASSLLQKELTKNELILKVKQSYLDLQQKKELRQLYQQIISTYERYYEMASVRVETGASNPIEKLTIQSALNEYRL